MIDVHEAMIRKLGELEVRFAELETAIGEPDLFNNPGGARSTLKEHSALKPMVEKLIEHDKEEALKAL